MDQRIEPHPGGWVTILDVESVEDLSPGTFAGHNARAGDLNAAARVAALAGDTTRLTQLTPELVRELERTLELAPGQPPRVLTRAKLRWVAERGWYPTPQDRQP